jgi:hypothetical protein
MTTTEARVSTGHARLLSSAWYQGKLWLAFNDGCFIIGDTKGQSHFIKNSGRSFRVFS